MIEKEIYAHKGEQITCENGHVICEIARNIKVGKTQEKGDLINWTQLEPEAGTYPIPTCSKCGAEFYRNDMTHGINVHFEDGWRE